MLAGPTEALVFAERGNPRFIAADLIAQAEHDPDAISIFVTTFRTAGREVAAEIERQLAQLPQTNLARRSLAKNGAVLVARRRGAAARFVNAFAPEHLSLPGDERRLARPIESAGSIFLGDCERAVVRRLRERHEPRAADGRSGAHARRAFRGGFREMHQRAGSVARGRASGWRPVVEEFARAEGLDAHARSVEVRE